jgi:hypothetical protein
MALREVFMTHYKSWLAAAALATALANSAFGAEPSFVGKWHWNEGKSSLAAGEPVPQDVQATIEAADAKKVSWTVTITDHAGKKHVETFEGAPDGTAAPVKGSSDGTMAMFTLAGNVMKSTFKSASGQTDTQSCALSEDQKTLNCAGTWNDGKGQVSKYVDVYDRM